MLMKNSKANRPKIDVSATLSQITTSTDRSFSTAVVEGLAATATPNTGS